MSRLLRLEFGTVPITFCKGDAIAIKRLSVLEETIAKILVNGLINKEMPLSYSELVDILEKKHGIKINAHFGLSVPLGNVSIACHELGLPLLSVRVQYKNDPTGKKTASGFYEIACQLKPQYNEMQPEAVRKLEHSLTRSCAEWYRLIDFLEHENYVPESMEKSLTLQQQFDVYVSEILAVCGQGHIVTTQDIIDSLVQRYGTNANSILPADFCYNRWNQGINPEDVCFFEYLEREQYRVLGKNYPFNGGIYARPKHGAEHYVGYCVNGKRQLGKAPIYPDEVDTASIEYLEGKKKSVQVNIYERNPAARLACLQKYGTKCAVCNFDFGAVYGPECQGMIHVHHLKMISDSEKEYVVDPVKDLRPVCPNCHMVIHSKPDCYTIEEVTAMLKH